MTKATGYAIIYGVPDSEGIIYDKGCLDNVDLSEVKATDSKSNPISTTKHQSLKLEVDNKGLKFTTYLPDGLTYSRDAIENIRNGNTLGVEIYADRVATGLHVTKVKRVRGIIITPSATGKYSSIKLVADAKGLHEMNDVEYMKEKEKLKLELELM